MVEPVKIGGHKNGCFEDKTIRIRQLYGSEYHEFYFVSDMNF
jgi:hypothetical protein